MPREQEGNDVDVELEHRLTSIEKTIELGNKSSEINDREILSRLDKLNGKVAVHEQYINAAKLEAATEKGFIAGRAQIHKRDLAILGVIVSAFVTVLDFLPRLIEAYK